MQRAQFGNNAGGFVVDPASANIGSTAAANDVPADLGSKDSYANDDLQSMRLNQLYKLKHKLEDRMEMGGDQLFAKQRSELQLALQAVETEIANRE